MTFSPMIKNMIREHERMYGAFGTRSQQQSRSPAYTHTGQLWIATSVYEKPTTTFDCSLFNGQLEPRSFTGVHRNSRSGAITVSSFGLGKEEQPIPIQYRNEGMRLTAPMTVTVDGQNLDGRLDVMAGQLRFDARGLYGGTLQAGGNEFPVWLRLRERVVRKQ